MSYARRSMSLWARNTRRLDSASTRSPEGNLASRSRSPADRHPPCCDPPVVPPCPCNAIAYRQFRGSTSTHPKPPAARTGIGRRSPASRPCQTWRNSACERSARPWGDRAALRATVSGGGVEREHGNEWCVAQVIPRGSVAIGARRGWVSHRSLARVVLFPGQTLGFYIAVVRIEWRIVNWIRRSSILSSPSSS